MATRPDAPLFLDEAKDMSADDRIETYPEDTVNAPGVEELPVNSDTSPLPDELSPVRIVNEPERPSVDLPVEILTAPEEEDSAVSKRISPDC
jgi:hypothetical protein